MSTQKVLRIVKYFSLLTFLVSSAFILAIYFSPTQKTVDYSVFYGLAFVCLSLILLIILVFSILRKQHNRRRLVMAFILVVGNLAIATTYYFIWDYAIGTILVKITNKTGQDVTDTGIYGCFHHNWGILKNGESRTIRFPDNVNCMFIVTYKLNGVVRHEELPRKDFTTNYYQLGSSRDIQVDK